MKHSPVYRKRIVLLSLFACVASLLGEARAQDLILPPQPAPPPILFIPEAVRMQLASARDAKARAKLSLEEAEARLLRVEGQTVLKQFNAATFELGIYQALIEDAVQVLQRGGTSDGKTRDLFKRLELVLRKHAARIEFVRRNTPSEYSGNVRAILNRVRDLRTASLEAFYGNTVLRENNE
ncbi:MAG: hypothetical protein ACR2G4_13485 [Pyrinomonadaceae bacterium]